MASRVLLSSSSRIAGQLEAASNNVRGGGRGYAAAAVARQEPSSAAGVASRLAEDATAASKKDGCFWMRNPKTGYWKQEKHFGDVDAADLRAWLLFSNKHYN
ncbi:hypothetical protein BRADI_3g37393v3 [Brachypodium distachyon]|uniref:Uncharacterized protein n=1 Tax=Brachypodium distachyon TaxID=15368 RepID=A0A0Q3FK41_BRADI|nr:hypothetical protein BRADI_3g37393v3 [Brachypodium distachyon]